MCTEVWTRVGRDDRGEESGDFGKTFKVRVVEGNECDVFGL